jgi:hypothetical protein
MIVQVVCLPGIGIVGFPSQCQFVFALCDDSAFGTYCRQVIGDDIWGTIVSFLDQVFGPPQEVLIVRISQNVTDLIGNAELWAEYVVDQRIAIDQIIMNRYEFEKAHKAVRCMKI